MFIGHKSPDGRIQLLCDHLHGVAERAQEFAGPFHGSAHAERTGVLHDAGKYSPAGQRRMNDPEHVPKVDHATAGAKIALEQFKDPYGAAVIIGHHGGIPDLGGKTSVEGDGTVKGRCKKVLTGQYDCSSFWTENKIENRYVFPDWLNPKLIPFAHVFYARMLFSCLVDADYLDTEAFMQPEQMPRGQYISMAALYEKLKQFIAPWLKNPANKLDAKRSQILQDCLEAAEQNAGFYSLTVPTGGGKTVSSLSFALRHAVVHGMKRVIYVVPYMSIIEQNAEVFRTILGEENVLEHHSGVELDEDDDLESSAINRKKMLATENWDAPIIVTTAVQFFESLFSNKPSKCRKLHNISDSVIIFDEAQMIPLPYLMPCIYAIAELVCHYKVTAVLCTATQPSLNRMISQYDEKLAVREICKDVQSLQTFFRRVHFRTAGVMHLEQVTEALSGLDQVLCIVNTRKSAQQIYRQLPEDGSYHLSTWMTPEHRYAVLKEVRKRLSCGQTCRVVSTSLLEAGVDVDFPEVWREMAGLDSVLQAAGRCNREGKRAAEDSEVVLFSLEGSVPANILPNRAAAEIAMEGVDNYDESPVITTYFDQLYRLCGEKSLDTKGILDLCSKYAFQSIAQVFHFIEDATVTVYIPAYARAEDIEILRNGEFSRTLMRRLGRCSVNIRKRDYEKMNEQGIIERIDESSGILIDERAYDAQCGLCMDIQSGEAIFV